ncbi:MAG: preprotein translocase subunit SecY [Candidatus Vogelbacteria bacterium]|nr:preprotein translocase subunit SecY [Candidatus Vogelbacteria bacterium]
MNYFLERLSIVFGDPALRRRIGITLGILILFRFVATIPIPGIDTTRLAEFLSGNSFFGLLNIFSGGGLSNLSIVMLGVGPYITGSIIMQLLTIVFPKVKEMYQEGGEAGKRKFTQYSRLLSIPLGLFQGFGLLTLLGNQGVLIDLSLFERAANVIVITAGSVFLMWLGELITEYGIGNGVSLLIFAGIVAGIPTTLSQVFLTFDISQIPLYLGFLLLSIAIVGAIVYITEAERPIPITYAKRVRGMKVYGGVSTYLPIRVNQAGVIPIIFALSLLLFPQLVATGLSQMNSEVAIKISDFLLFLTTNPWVYSITYFVLVFGFTYFYTAITFDPENIAENLQKSGAFVPGVRPGRPTALYINRVLTRLTLVGALFLGAIAVLPLILQAITGNPALAIGGTGLLIVVSVALELLKQIDAQATMREY